MTKSRVLLLSTLIKGDACSAQVKTFKALFGGSVEVTPELCLKMAAEFDWNWAAENLLTAAALAEYDKATAATRAEYYKVNAATWAEYYKTTAATRAEYYKATAAAWGTLYCSDHLGPHRPLEISQWWLFRTWLKKTLFQKLYRTSL